MLDQLHFLLKPEFEKLGNFDHGEFVTNENLETIPKMYPSIKWDMGSTNRPIYSHITAFLDDNLKVKFHNKSISECVKLERTKDNEKY